MWIFYCVYMFPPPTPLSVGAQDGLPADQTEPGEAVVKGVAARHHALGVLGRGGRNLGSSVVHLPHEVQSLAADERQVC